VKLFLFNRGSRSVSVCGLLALAVACVTAGPASAAHLNESNLAWGDISACGVPVLAQPFLSAKDSNWYTLTPGESADGFDGTGWTLSGGATVKASQLADGSSSTALDLPSGALAISPPICVSSDYPTARTMVRDVTGAEGVRIDVAYAGTRTESAAQTTGQVHGQQSSWTLSDPFNVHPGNLTGWQLMRFTLVPGGKHSDFQIYDFYVDPKMYR
jgi:hypothetical protein